MNNKKIREFTIELDKTTPYEKISDTMIKVGVRLFYLGENRNGGYITEEFAKKLVQTLPYTPVKGIFNGDEYDYEGHGYSCKEGRIYGIVPENPNARVVSNYDPDNKERSYVAADVYLFSALYEEQVEDIVGKGQSMELLPDSIDGEWVDHNGEELFHYTEGSFLGLQILGKEYEPCFEGAAFFSLTPKRILNLLEEGGSLVDKNKKNNEPNVKHEVDEEVVETEAEKHIPTDHVDAELIAEKDQTIKELKEKLELANKEVEELREFKHGVEREEKMTILNSFSDIIEEDTLKNFEEEIDKYSALDLEKELAYIKFKKEQEEPAEVEEEEKSVEEEGVEEKPEEEPAEHSIEEEEEEANNLEAILKHTVIKDSTIIPESKESNTRLERILSKYV